MLCLNHKIVNADSKVCYVSFIVLPDIPEDDVTITGDGLSSGLLPGGHYGAGEGTGDQHHSE